MSTICKRDLALYLGPAENGYGDYLLENPGKKPDVKATEPECERLLKELATTGRMPELLDRYAKVDKMSQYIEAGYIFREFDKHAPGWVKQMGDSAGTATPSASPTPAANPVASPTTRPPAGNAVDTALQALVDYAEDASITTHSSSEMTKLLNALLVVLRGADAAKLQQTKADFDPEENVHKVLSGMNNADVRTSFNNVLSVLNLPTLPQTGGGTSPAVRTVTPPPPRIAAVPPAERVQIVIESGNPLKKLSTAYFNNVTPAVAELVQTMYQTMRSRNGRHTYDVIRDDVIESNPNHINKLIRRAASKLYGCEKRSCERAKELLDKGGVINDLKKTRGLDTDAVAELEAYVYPVFHRFMWQAKGNVGLLAEPLAIATADDEHDSQYGVYKTRGVSEDGDVNGISGGASLQFGGRIGGETVRPLDSMVYMGLELGLDLTFFEKLDLDTEHPYYKQLEDDGASFTHVEDASWNRLGITIGGTFDYYKFFASSGFGISASVGAGLLIQKISGGNASDFMAVQTDELDTSDVFNGTRIGGYLNADLGAVVPISRGTDSAFGIVPYVGLTVRGADSNEYEGVDGSSARYFFGGEGHVDFRGMFGLKLFYTHGKDK